MPRTPGPVGPLPPNAAAITFEQLCEAIGCPDCASEVLLLPVPIGLPDRPITLFGYYVAHDETCPAVAAAAAQQRGNQ